FYSDGSGADGLAVGDFNADGRLDVVSGDNPASLVRVMSQTRCVPSTPPAPFIDAGLPLSMGHYLKAKNTDALDFFGSSVAMSGPFLAVGAPGEDSAGTGDTADRLDNSASGAGAAYVYLRAGSAWTTTAYVKPSNADPDDQFGAAVAISGVTLVVGAPGEDSDTTGVNHAAPRSGAAYVFTRVRPTWVEQARLKAFNAAAGDGFGTSVAISGSTVVVGAPQQGNGSGAAYVFVGDAGAWSAQAYLKASNADPGDNFGTVGVSGDLIVVGAPGESSSARGVNGDPNDNTAPASGAAYLFARDAGTW